MKPVIIPKNNNREEKDIISKMSKITPSYNMQIIDAFLIEGK